MRRDRYVSVTKLPARHDHGCLLSGLSAHVRGGALGTAWVHGECFGSLKSVEKSAKIHDSEENKKNRSTQPRISVF